MATASSLSGAGRQNAWDAIAASATDSVLVAASGSKKIRVHAFVINHGDTTASAVTFNSKPAGSGVAIYPPLKGTANGGFFPPEAPSGYFETLRGEGLTVTTSAGSTTSISVVYSLIA